MTPEQALKIAASQWKEIPTAEQIIAALDAAGFSILPQTTAGADDSPVEVVREILLRRNIKPHALAKAAGIAASTLTRALNDPSHKFLLSNTTMSKIKKWDLYGPGR